ncbi:MAG: metallophosphoesterase [Vampirovibrionales bacterium]|nr:metallophosphoesterase [Vampirovibrionales bacterium]
MSMPTLPVSPYRSGPLNGLQPDFASQIIGISPESLAVAPHHTGRPIGQMNILTADTLQLSDPSAKPLSITQPVPSLALEKTDAIKRFAVIGDAGTGEDGQFDIAQGLQREFQRQPFASTLVLGDNAYPKYQDASQLEAVFDRCIGTPYMPLKEQGIRFFPVLGNHDVDKQDFGGLNQLKYWSRLNDIFSNEAQVPRYYSQRLGNTEIFALDATVFFPYYGDSYNKNPQFAVEQAARQLQWLDQALGQSDARFKVVYGHYPIYSVTEGKEPPGFVAQWRQLIEPLLNKHGVDVYLAGHNHDYEKAEVNGVHYFVSGAGGRLAEHKPSEDLFPIYPVEKMITQRHFMMFEEKPDGLAYQVIGQDANQQRVILDEGVIPDKKKSAENLFPVNR